MALSLVTGPTVEPLLWAQVQKQLRLEGLEDDKDFVTTVLVPAARERCELATRRAVSLQTWDLVLDRLPAATFVEIPKPPLIAVVSFSYVDMGGVTRTLTEGTDYLVQAPAGPRCQRGRVALPFASVWPVTLPQMGAVSIRFTCGYPAPDDATVNPGQHVPPLLLSAMLTDCGRLYEYRESLVVDSRAVGLEVPGSARDIYRSFRSYGRQRLVDDDVVARHW